uniref:Uncharacterized protein n=1 Tax=Odontella aurita TaxID=265563 RepID=A0A7S4N7F9_9STRA|mmetsp:Transcript_51065/g.153489  ORF Transcript_51065/g.153489 Transcript_51065/m.153489 type:complete len:138 (+) Transcript_51065:562-975(+)
MGLGKGTPEVPDKRQLGWKDASGRLLEGRQRPSGNGNSNGPTEGNEEADGEDENPLMPPGGGTADGVLPWFLRDGGLPWNARGGDRASASLPSRDTMRDITGKIIVAQEPDVVDGASARGRRDGMGSGAPSLHLRRR